MNAPWQEPMDVLRKMWLAAEGHPDGAYSPGWEYHNGRWVKYCQPSGWIEIQPGMGDGNLPAAFCYDANGEITKLTAPSTLAAMMRGDLWLIQTESKPPA